MKVGIWIDTREAYVVKVSRDVQEVTHVISDIETFHPIGGSRSNVPYGPVDTVSESKYLEKRKHQEAEYFDNIISEIKSCNNILIFGPGHIKLKLKKRIEARTELRIKVLECIQSDSITEKQMIAFVKDYFHLPNRKS